MQQPVAVLNFVLLVIVLCTAAVMDLKTGKIRNWLTVPAILAGFALSITAGALQGGGRGAWDGMEQVSIAFALAFVPFLILAMIGGLGGGDAKLMGCVGALSASCLIVISTMVYTLVVAIVIAVVMMIRRRIFKQTMMRVLTAAFSFASGVKPIMPQDGPRLPFALAVCIGGILAAYIQMTKDHGWPRLPGCMYISP